MVVIEQLEVKRNEFIGEHDALVYASVQKNALKKKIDILTELIDIYRNFFNSPPPDLDPVKVKEALENQCCFEQPKKKIIEQLEIAGSKPFIWCLVGPSGTGKTTFAQVLAQALEKDFFSFALGGMSDPSILTGKEDEIGLLTRALLETKSVNPVFLLDEIDKSSKRVQDGLLNFLDKAQNNNIFNHYLGVNLDFSQITFIATANKLEDASLRSRMKIIELPSYTIEQKKEITRSIIRKWLTDNESSLDNLNIADEALETLINKTKEKGIRQLKQALEDIFNYYLNQWSNERRAGETPSKIIISPELVNKIISYEFTNIDQESEENELTKLQKKLSDLRKERDGLAKGLVKKNETKIKAARLRALNTIQQRLNNTKLKKENLDWEDRNYEEKLNNPDLTVEDVEIIREEVLLKIEQKFVSLKSFLKEEKGVKQSNWKIFEQWNKNSLEQSRLLRQLLNSEIERLKKEIENLQTQQKSSWSTQNNPWFIFSIVVSAAGIFYIIFKLGKYDTYPTKKKKKTGKK